MKQLILEGVAVGAASVPVWIVAQEVSAQITKEEWKQQILTPFLMGLGIHFLAEATGVNAWYVLHGHASKMSVSYNNVKHPPKRSGCVSGVCEMLA